MHEELSLQKIKKEWHGTLKSYLYGFVLSLLLTGLSFFLVFSKSIQGSVLIYSLAILALVQAIIQLIFFLHVGQEAKPRWESLSFWFMILILLIIVVGSLWIMYDLDDRVMKNMSKEMSP